MLTAANFSIRHNDIFNAQAAWSRSFDGFLVTSIWDNSFINKDGKILSNIFQNNKAHLDRIKNAIKNNIPIFGALKHHAVNGRQQHIASNVYFTCKPILDNNGVPKQFCLTPANGDIREIIKNNHEHPADSLDVRFTTSLVRIMTERQHAEKTFDFQHAILELKLIDKLHSLQKSNDVCEIDWEREIGKNCHKRQYDVAIRHKSLITSLFEVKTNSTASKCVRAALGQLIEYKHLIDADQEPKILKNFIVVGPVNQAASDESFIKYIAEFFQEKGISFKYMQI